ncbi:MAG TPA: AAA family ATPase [Candidatus Limnocylindria bacterium]|nr:AAA family ATPase [Candidatus Limnocylindria bacterium]
MVGRVSSATFVGRRPELDRFVAALPDGSPDRPSLVLVAGEAGVGKSRFLQEAMLRARESGARTVQGGCVDISASLAYGPIVEALRDLADQLPAAELERALAEHRGGVARLLPDLAPPGEPSGSASMDRFAQGRLYEHLLSTLRRLARERPLVVAIEDIHWADRSTLDLVTFLVHSLRDAPVLLIATYRSDEVHRSHPLLPMLAEAERSNRSERIELRRFNRLELVDLLNAIVGGDADPELVDDVFERSGGNAFFAEELLAAGVGRRDVPHTLRDVLLARIAILSRPTQEVMRVAAAGGTTLATTVLRLVAGLEDDRLTAALRESVDRQILVVNQGANEETYGFRHKLMQEAIYLDLLPGERTRLHAAFAEVLSEHSGDGGASRSAQLAYHWFAANDLPRALVASVEAGRVADGSYGFAEAFAHYERALALWDQVPDAEARLAVDRIQLHERAGQSAAAVRSARAVSHIEAALALVDPDTDPVRAGLLYERLGRYRWLSSSPGTVAAYTEAVRLVPAAPASEARARVLAGLAQYLNGGDDVEAAAVAQDAVETARAVHAADIEAHALVTFGSARCNVGWVAEGLSALEEAKRVASEVGDMEDLVRAHKYTGICLSAAQQLDEGAAASFEAFELARRHGLAQSHGAEALVHAAWNLLDLGRLDEAERALDLVERYAPQGASASATAAFHDAHAWLAIWHGKLDQARQHVEALERMARRDEEGQLKLWAYDKRASLAIAEGRPLEARRAVQQAFAVTEKHDDWADHFAWTCALGIRAEADIASSARRDTRIRAEASQIAAHYLAEVHKQHQHVLTERPAFATAWARLRTLCEAEASRIDGGDPDPWARAADAFADLGSPWWVAYARFRQAEALLAGMRSRAVARPALAEAHRIALELGATPLRELIEGLLRRARVSLPTLAPERNGRRMPHRFKLTRREDEVLQQVAAGRTNRQIAESLFITEKTAGVHVSNILAKLDARSRTEAAAIALHEGLIPSANIVASPNARRPETLPVCARQKR